MVVVVKYAGEDGEWVLRRSQRDGHGFWKVVPPPGETPESVKQFVSDFNRWRKRLESVCPSNLTPAKKP